MIKVQVEKVATLIGHKDCIYSLEKGFSDTQFFSAGADGMVVLWDLKNPDIGSLIAKVPNSIYALISFPIEENIIVGQNYEGVHLINVSKKAEIKSSRCTNSYIFDIKGNKNEIYVACGDGSLMILDRFQLKLKQKLSLSSKSIRAIAFHPFEDLYAIGLSDNTIRILSLKKNQVLFEINAHQNSIFTLTFSPDGNYLLSGSRDAHLKIWECKSQFQLYNSITAHMYAINNIQYNIGGNLFATASMDKSIKIWNAEDFKLLKIVDKARYASHNSSVNKLLWMEGKTLISASDDKIINVWDIDINTQQL